MAHVKETQLMSYHDFEGSYCRSRVQNDRTMAAMDALITIIHLMLRLGCDLPYCMHGSGK